MHIRTMVSTVCLPVLCACTAQVDAGHTATDSVTEALGQQEQPLAGQRHRELDVRQVLLLSIDGMHQVDLEKFIATHPASTLAQLASHGAQYTQAYVNRLDGSATNPSDSFPGLLALTTGGSSPTHGGWYDVSYARDLFAYDAVRPCSGAPGTAVAYDESVELDSDAGFPSLWGSETDNTPTHVPAVVRSRIDPTKLPYAKTARGCTPVFPHEFIRVNTIFEVAHEAGLHTAWSDKHLAYELVTGPSGRGLDDFFAPEINSVATNLIPSAPAGDDYTTHYSETEVYDDFKVQAILNQIDGKWSDDGLPGATDTAGRAPGVPAIFGMNFQAVSVAQKNARSGHGGYLDAAGTPDSEVADALAHTDASIGRMVARLTARGRLDSTAIIVTAKHGQSPIDKTLVSKVDGDAVAALVDAAAPVAGHIEDDVALYWLKDRNTASAAVSALLAPPSSVDPMVDTVYSTAVAGFAQMFGDPARDPRTPDVIVKVQHGVIYSLSTKKFAEHGGFADDDSHVALLISNPRLTASRIDTPVRTKQVAPTILELLDLQPQRLDAVRREGTTVLPGL
ncbi:MAG TPA: alkaline phosphatase family protein [Polyangiales bacterium]